MANDLATLKTALALALRDASNAVWTAAENGDLLTWAAASLYPKVSRSVREDVTLADDDDQYDLSTVTSVSRVDLIDGDGRLLMPLPGGAWELWGDGITASPTLFINRSYARTGWTLRVHGYGAYDLSSNLPPDVMVPAILARARAEALRRMLNDRAKFAQWAKRNQLADSSVNELVLMVNEADANAREEMAKLKTWRKPVPARVG